MPYGIKHAGSKWVVYNKATGHVFGKHATKSEAEAQLAAIMASTGGKAAEIGEVRDDDALEVEDGINDE